MKRLLVAVLLLLSVSASAYTPRTGDFFFNTGRPWADVRAFGATGNGTTDDTAAIVSAVTQVATLGTGTVYFPPGSYCTASGISITAPGIILQGASGSSGPTQITTCGHDVTGIYLDAATDIITHMNVVGGVLGTTHPAVLVGTGCMNCVIEHSALSGGIYALQIQGTGTYASNIAASNSYGSAVVYTNGSAGVYLLRDKINQAYPGTTPAYGSSFSARANSTIYAQNAIVSLSGYYIQATVGGTSGASAPSLASYGTNIADGSVTWQLVAPTAYYGLQIDTGSARVSEIYADHIGPFTQGILISNGSSGTVPQNIEVEDSNFSSEIGAGIRAIAGNGLRISHNLFSGCILTGCEGVLLDTGWNGDSSITGNNFYGDANSILVNAGKNTIISDNNISNSVVNGIDIAANVTDFIISSNMLNTSPLWGANTATILVNTGTSDYYEIVNNDVHGVAVVDNGSGSHKTLSGNN